MLSTKMSTTETSVTEINPEEDDLQAVATKLGVEENQGRDKIIPTEKQLRRINGELDDDGNSYLIRFAKLGKSDVVEFLLRFDGILVNHENKNDYAATDIALEGGQLHCLLKLLEADAFFPASLCSEEVDDEGLKTFLQKREDLHDYIEAGDLESVKDALRDQKPSILFNGNNQSALFHAANCGQPKIFAHLLSIGAKFRDEDEEMDVCFNDCEREELNGILDDQFLKIENYHVMKLFYRSKSPQAITGRRYEILKGLYDYLSQFEIIDLIMKVLEFEDIDVVFDFESEHTNKIYCMNNCEIYGLTNTSMKRIFIGAKKCSSVNGVCMEVAGTLAHELCHMAMEVVYRNDAKPYAVGEECASRVQDYTNLVNKTDQLIKDGGKIDEIISKVYKHYYKDQWESELIVRVPEILAAYGKVEGQKILQTQAESLYDFYIYHVVEDTRGYANPAYFKKGLRSIEYLHKYHGCISEVDKEENPFITSLKSFRSYLVKKKSLQMISTNIVKLCSLHIYHEIKISQRYHMDTACLFFRLDVFLNRFEDILKAFDCSACRLLVLVCHHKIVDIDVLEGHFCNNDLESEKKEVILVVGKDCEILSKKDKPRFKSIDYLWKDLSKSYRDTCLGRCVNFKGHESFLISWIRMEDLSKIIQSDDLVRLTAEETIMFGDGKKESSHGYKSYYYVERDLAKVTLEASLLTVLSDTTVLYITGLSKKESSGLNLDKNKIHWLGKQGTNVDYSKSIFIREKKGEISFSDEFEALKGDSRYWFHYSDKYFHVVALRGRYDRIANYLKTNVSSEEDLIDSRNRIVLISDDPGTGKSTLLSSLIRKINERHPKCWVGRLDLIDHAVSIRKGVSTETKTGKVNLSLGEIKKNSRPEDVLDVFFRMIGFNSKLDVYLMKKFTKAKKVGMECKVFLDGYDEASSTYRENLMKLIGTLINETCIQLWITTRVHERIDLEVELGTCSFSLVQFSNEKMVSFLDKLWKHKLLMSESIQSEQEFLNAKDKLRRKITDILVENVNNMDPLFEGLRQVVSESAVEIDDVAWGIELQNLRHRIETLDFRPFANYLILRSSIKDAEIKFTGIPLHLFMVGSVSFDKNLQTDFHSDLYGLYTEFVEGKMEIYWKEKLGITYCVAGTLKLYEREQKRVFDIHMGVARSVICGGKSRKVNKKDVEDNEIAVSVGILTKTGDNFQFIHRTFAEYFFAEWILRNMEERILMEVMFDEKYNLVRMFLSSALDREDRKVEMAESSFENLRMESFFKSFAKKPMIRDSNAIKIFRKILQAFEDVCDEETMDDFVLKFAKFLNQKTFADYIKAFWFLQECLTDKMLADLFGRYIDLTFRTISIIIKVCNEVDLKDIFEELERAFKSRLSNEIEQDRRSDDEEGVGQNISETRGGKGLILKLVLFRDASGYGVLHFASMNPKDNVFTSMLGILERVLEEEDVRRCILERTKDGSSIIHCSATTGALNVEEILCSIEGRASISDVLTSSDETGKNVLHVASENLQVRPFIWLLGFLSNLDNSATLRNLLVQRDQNGKTILHYMFKFGSSYKIENVLQELKGYLGEQELKDLMKVRDKNGNNIFHVIGEAACLEDVSFFEKYFNGDELEELLLQVDNSGMTCLHLSLGFTFSETKDVINTLKELGKVLNPDSFLKLLNTRDNNGATIFQYLRQGLGVFVSSEKVCESIREHFPEINFQNML